MADLHINDFYKDVAKTFARLYSSFPQKIILYVDEIAGEDQPDEFGLHSERFVAGFSAMIWLAEQGYIRYNAPIKQEALDQAVLTDKGFLLLSTVSEFNFGGEDCNNDDLPSSVLSNQKSNINQLRYCLKSGSSIFIEQCISYLLNKS